jgi:hypothetical protein
MSNKREVAREIKNWCKKEFTNSSWAWVANLEGDGKTIHVAIVMKTERTPELDATIVQMTSTIKRKFSAENLEIGVYDKRVPPQRPKRS